MPAPRATPKRYAPGLAMVWLRESPTRRRLMGAALTVAGVAVIGLLGG